MTSVVLTQRLVTVLACYTKALNESEPHTPCHKFTAVQTTNLWLPNKLLMILASYNKIALHRVTTKPPVTIVGFDIWNFIFLLSATRFSAVCSDTANQWREERPPPYWLDASQKYWKFCTKVHHFCLQFRIFFLGKGQSPSPDPTPTLLPPISKFWICRCGQSFLFNGPLRHKLQWRHIRNRIITENLLCTIKWTVKKWSLIY